MSFQNRKVGVIPFVIDTKVKQIYFQEWARIILIQALRIAEEMNASTNESWQSFGPKLPVVYTKYVLE